MLVCYIRIPKVQILCTSHDIDNSCSIHAALQLLLVQCRAFWGERERT